MITTNSSNKSKFLYLVVFILGILVGRFLPSSNWKIPSSPLIKFEKAPTNDRIVLEWIEQIMIQRNQLSQLLNRKLETLGILTCEKIEKKSSSPTSEGGAYCLKGMKSAHMTDKKMIEFFKPLFKDKRVASFGEGLGHYKRELEGVARVFDGYDGAPYTRSLTEGRVRFLDLSVPVFGLPQYDVILSLEVAEHIPQEFEQTFLDNLVRFAGEAVILSWSRPGQGGYAHVNNRPLEYIQGQMEKRGFRLDGKVSGLMQEAASFSWLKNNVNYYVRNA